MARFTNWGSGPQSAWQGGRGAAATVDPTQGPNTQADPWGAAPSGPGEGQAVAYGGGRVATQQGIAPPMYAPGATQAPQNPYTYASNPANNYDGDAQQNYANLAQGSIGELNDLRNDYKNYTGATPIQNDQLGNVSYDPSGNPTINRAGNGYQYDAQPTFNGQIAGDALGNVHQGQFDTTIQGDANTQLAARAANGPYNPKIANDQNQTLINNAGTAQQFALGGQAGMGIQQAGAGSASVGEYRSDMSPLESFDAAGSYNTFLQGATGKYQNILKLGLNNLRNTAAGGNRLNTGFFDIDTGQYGRDVGQDFANTASEGALQTNAQDLSARTALVSSRTGENASIRSTQAQTSIANANNQTSASVANANNSVQGARLSLDALSESDRAAIAAAANQRGDQKFSADRYDQQTTDLQGVRNNQVQDRTAAQSAWDQADATNLKVAGVQRDDQKFAYNAGQDAINRSDTRVNSNRSNDLAVGKAQNDAWAATNDARFKAADVQRQASR